MWHDTDSGHNFSRVSRVVSSPHISASGKNCTVLCVICPDSDTPVPSQETCWVHSHSCDQGQPFPCSLQHTPPHCSQLPPPPLITGNALLPWHHPVRCASRNPGEAGAHPAVLCVGRSKEQAWQACHQVGMLAAGGFPAPRPREVPHPHGHSCSCHLEMMKAALSINPSACSGLRGNQAQFSIQTKANFARNIFSFEGPDGSHKPLLYLRVSSQRLQVFSSMFKAILVFLTAL